jgi:hypothetical protein
MKPGMLYVTPNMYNAGKNTENTISRNITTRKTGHMPGSRVKLNEQCY